MPRIRVFAFCLACVLFLSLHAFAETPNPRKIPFAWFDEPEQHAPHWDVDFDNPTLLYSQRFLLGARAIMPAKEKERRPDWHILLRIADENGRWFQGVDYTHLDLQRAPEAAHRISWHGYAFAQPGTYRVALLAYDATGQRHFLWRKTVRVDRPSVLPDIDRELPKVEFLELNKVRFPIPEYLPVQTRRPVRIDVVVNLTGDLQLSVNTDYFTRYRQPYVENTLRGATALLTQLAPSQGCVRVSAIDILHLKVALDRSSADPASHLDRVQQAIAGGRDSDTVDVRTLMGRTRAREFFHQFLDKVVTDNAGCGPQVPNTERAIVVISDSLIFPKGTDNEPVSPPERRDASFFHIRISSNRVPTYDQVGHMLEQLHPRRFNVADPKDLRRAVAEIIKDIESTTTR